MSQSQTSILLGSLIAVSLGLSAGCSAANEAPSEEEDAATLSADTLRCSAPDSELVVSSQKGGDGLLFTLSKNGTLFQLHRDSGKIARTASTLTWSGAKTSLAVDLRSNELRGTLKNGAKSVAVVCRAAGSEATSWKVADALVDYAAATDSLVSNVLEYSESETPRPNPYSIYAVETARRSSVSLGNILPRSKGALPGAESDTDTLYENDCKHGPLGAAFAYGPSAAFGDEYYEWFLSASEEMSLSDLISPLLGTARAGFVAREHVTALSNIVGGGNPTAIEITIGAWTFLLPGTFPLSPRK